ncbi:MAG: hypothetical protein RR828_00540 [Oscillospiraceae bacterium]
MGAIINRVKSAEMQKLVDTGDIPVLSFIPEDDQLALMDVEGNSLLMLSGDAPTLQGLREALKKMDII